ncbi:MAG: hypothetical protein ACX939_15285, partial [Hyphococcus sp.]
MKRGLTAGVSAIALIATAAAPQASFAQAAGADDTIIVTGSFIRKRSQADLPSPLQTVGQSDIKAIGANNFA